MWNVCRWVVLLDSFDSAIESWIEKVGAACRIPLQPGVRSQISGMMFADHEANACRAVGPQDCVKQNGFAFAIGGDIGVDLRRCFPLTRIPVRDRAQASHPLVEGGEGGLTRRWASGRIQDGRNRAHLAIIRRRADREKEGLREARGGAYPEAGSQQRDKSRQAKGRGRYGEHLD